MGRPAIDITGRVFGRLTIVERDYSHTGELAYWICACSCGVRKSIAGADLRRGRARSCGCLMRTHRVTHGKTRTATYKSWNDMLARCGLRSAAGHVNYAGRGITVCDRWMRFENFLADMGEKPSRRFTVERIDVNGNYEPGNVRWATKTEQSRNTRSTKLSEAAVVQMRWLAKEGGVRTKTLSVAFGVTPGHVRKVVRGDQWVANDA